MPDQHCLEVRSLSHVYRRGREKALNDVSFVLGNGAVGVLGPNGAGKSTLQRILASTLQSQSGQVLLDGIEQRKHLTEYRRLIGYLPQRFGYLPHFTVVEFVEYSAWMKLVPPRSVRPSAERAISDVGLSDASRKKLRELSGGMLRRVGIAQAIVNQPALLLLDEPTVGLDPEQRGRLRSVLGGLEERMAIIMSTHLTEDIAAICGQVMVMSGGSVLFHGSSSDLAELGVARDRHQSQLDAGYSQVLRMGVHGRRSPS
jgi:ABC-type multidrug transport system ATPase subunit